jgi:hypothetical protein
MPLVRLVIQELAMGREISIGWMTTAVAAIISDQPSPSKQQRS